MLYGSDERYNCKLSYDIDMSLDLLKCCTHDFSKLLIKTEHKVARHTRKFFDIFDF